MEIGYRTDPEAYGVDLQALPTSQKGTWERQELFLSAYAGFGTLTSTAARVGVPVRTVYHWRDRDVMHFASRLDEATQHCINAVEDMYMERLKETTSKSSPLWFFGWLKANHREKWGDMVVIDSNDSKETRKELQKLRKEWNETRPNANEDGEVDNQVVRLSDRRKSGT